MPTATAQAQKVTFVAGTGDATGSRNLRVLLKPRRDRNILDAAGARVATQEVPVTELPPQGWLHNAAEEEGFEYESLPPYIDFKNWTHETEDPNEIAALRAHPSFRSQMPDGFHERYPTAEEQLAEVARLTANRNLVGLSELVEREEALGNHRNVIDAAEAAMEALLDTDASPEGAAEGQTPEGESTADSQADGDSGTSSD